MLSLKKVRKLSWASSISSIEKAARAECGCGTGGCWRAGRMLVCWRAFLHRKKRKLHSLYPWATADFGRCDSLSASPPRVTNAKSLGLNYIKVHWAIYSLAINLTLHTMYLIFLFTKNALIWSKVTANTFIMLQEIYISNKCITVFAINWNSATIFNIDIKTFLSIII